MRRCIALLILGVAPFLYGCSSGEDADVTICTPSFNAGIAVSIFDADTGDPLIAAEATGLIQDGSYIENLQHFGSPNILSGAYERPGIYTISISLPGYFEWKMSDVQVTGDECHVITVRIDAFLTKSLNILGE